ncbi:ABC transporter substrate-binding protein [Thauera propionica]|uniref:ABC transporter substrate-binding protein n=1 Tax=Thauera propionica TaxID=2019431 RepID=UPI0023F40841|nr:ABC transporter substrate binding protein [Thauera propionica]MDD3674006.1 ABC transporter substrate binding protein [Thauera propionica]
MAGLLLGLVLPARAGLDVAVVVSQRGGAHAAFAQAFSRAAAGLGHRVLDAGTPAEGLDDVALARADLVVASGDAALSAALRLNPRPTLAAMIGQARFDALRMAHPDRPLSAFTLDQPAERQFRLLKAVLPDARRAGVLLGPERGDRVDLERAAAASGLDLFVRVIGDEAELIRGLEAVLRDSDSLIAVPDAMLSSPSAARSILLTSYRFQKPIVAFSRAYVDAGALAAIFTTPEQVAADLIAWLRLQKDESVQLPPPRGPASFDIAVNRQVARALGLSVADDAELLRLIATGDQP